jgi:PST family polysaccharide transporter
MALRKRAARGATWSLVERWGAEVLAIAVFVVLSRQLSVQAFGLVAFAMVVIDFARRIVDGGFAEAVVQRGELDRAHLDTAFWTGLVIGGVMAAGVAGLATPIAAAFGQPELAPVLRWLSLGFVVRGLSSTQQAILVRSLRFNQLAIRTLVAELGAGIVAISLALNGWGVWSLVAQQLTAGILGVITLWTVAAWRPGLAFRWSIFRELAAFGVPIVGFKLLNVFSHRVDKLLIGSFLGTVALGYYEVATRIFHAITKVLGGVLGAVAFPVFSRLQNDRERMQRAYYEGTQLTCLVVLPAFFGLVAIAPDAIPWAFGAKWEPSVPVMRVLAGVGILQSLTRLNGSLIKAAGKPAWRLWVAVLQIAVTTLAILAVVEGGITAVAFATLGASLAVYPLAIGVVRRLIDIRIGRYAAQFVGPLVAALLCAAAALGARMAAAELATPTRIGIAVAAGAVAYGVALRLVAPALLRRVQVLAADALPIRRIKPQAREA